MGDDVRICKADVLDGDTLLIELNDQTTLKVGLEQILSLRPERFRDDGDAEDESD